MGAPGLAFETWDPSNQFPLETPSLLFVIRSEAPPFSFHSMLGNVLFRRQCVNMLLDRSVQDIVFN
jgi:hypothetical protein